MCSEGDLGGRRPGEPSEDGGLVEGFGEGSGPESQHEKKKSLVVRIRKMNRERGVPTNSDKKYGSI